MKLTITSGNIPDPELLETASYGLTRALGGGLMSGRIHVIWGKKGGTKSSLAMHQIAKAQKQGKICLYVDSEKTYSSSWAEKCGVDVDKLKYLKGNIVEDILEAIIPMIHKEEINLLVVDSLSSMFVGSFFDKEGANPIGVGARSSKFFLIKLLNVLGPETQVILISHASMDLSGYIPMTTAAIGNAVAHWSSTIINLSMGNSKDKDFREDGARKVKWKIEKSKQSVYPYNGEFWFHPRTAAIDTASEVIDTAIELELIDRKGAWFLFGDEKFQGKDNVVARAHSDLDFLDKVKEAINKYDTEVRPTLAKSIEEEEPDVD